MKKTAFFLVLLALTAFAASAQRFDWATGFGSSHEGCLIKGTVTDDEGNLYILGQFTNNATWEGHRLLPIAPYGPGANSVTNLNTLIAKVSPDGQMLWKKVIHSNNNQYNTPMDIKKVGDTAFACLVEMILPSSDSYTYYLDTLLPTWSDYPVEAWGMGLKLCTAYLLFDFEGNVLEQHILQLTYTDTAGNDIYCGYSDGEPWYWNDRYFRPSFDVDAGGNIYITRIANDWITDDYRSQDGTISSVKFWVDRRLAGTCAVENRPMQWFPQLLKFSPHFDTLLDSRYVVQKCDSVDYEVLYTRTKLDADGNVYYLMTQNMRGKHDNTIVIDSSRGLQFHHHDLEREKAFLVRFDSSLTPQWLITLEDSVTNPAASNRSALLFHDIGFDNDSNLMFITATTGRGRVHDTNTCSILTYHGNPLSLRNVAFFMSFKTDLDNPQIYSYGSVQSLFGSEATSSSTGNIACKNNRVFIQSTYMGGVSYPSLNVQFDDSYAYGLGLSIFDYRGTPIMGVDYAALSPRNEPGSMCLKDSILYVSGRLTSDATFGDIYLPNQEDFAFIARYVDTAFMTPYVYTGDTSDVRITVVDDEGAFVVYPNPFRQRVTIKVEGGEPLVETAWLTDLTGRQEQVRLTAEGTGRYSLDLTARPQASYLLTLTTVSGKTHTLRLLKQSDVFAQ